MNGVHKLDVLRERRRIEPRKVLVEGSVLFAIEEREEPAAGLRSRTRADERRRPPRVGMRALGARPVEDRGEVAGLSVIMIERQQVVVARRALRIAAVSVEEQRGQVRPAVVVLGAARAPPCSRKPLRYWKQYW